MAVGAFTGPSPGDAVSLVFAQPYSTELDGIRLSYSPWFKRLALVRYDTRGGSGGEFTVSTLASATIDLGTAARGWKVVADAATSTIRSFIDQGAGYPATATLTVTGVTVPPLGWTGMVRESESPGTVAVDRFTVRRPVAAATVASLTLIDADTDQPIPGQEALLDGVVLNLAQVPHRRLNVRANVTGGSVGSVRFGLDALAAYHDENSQPYALAGDAVNGTDYLPWIPTVGDHRLTATPFSGTNAGGTAGNPLSVRFTVIDAASPVAAAINFQPANSAIPAGYVPDSGALFGLRSSGLVYGWNRVVPDTRERNDAHAPDQRQDTLILMQKTGSDPVWEIALPRGTYLVELVAGDPSFIDSDYRISVEGYSLITAVPTTAARFAGGSAIITVLDGRLTLHNVAGAVNNKLCFIVITPASGNG
ncbi:MAG TPA: hypothetical protein VHX44_07180 [Planctomycetota bacterium]|nr:hypothetical protein [Planctomycetota bacterium]